MRETLPFQAIVCCPDRQEVEHILPETWEGILGDTWNVRTRRFTSHETAEAWAEALCFEVATRVDIYAAQSVDYAVEYIWNERSAADAD